MHSHTTPLSASPRCLRAMFVVCAAFFFASRLAAASEPAGFAFAPDASGQRVPIPLESTEVVLDVKPGLLEAEVIQTFTNRTTVALEATYLYPLPGDATLTAFELRFRDRVVRSEVREKAAARAAYETAKTDGRKAALLEQLDPTLFSTAVANFLPGETVRVVLRFTQPLALSTNTVDVRFPMVTGQKYFPADVAPGTSGNAAPDPQRRAPDAIAANHVYAFDIQIAGLPLRLIESPSHRVHSERTGLAPERHRVALASEITIPDRDFVLRLHLREAETPQATLVTQHTATGDYGLVTVFPPRTLPPGAVPPRPRDVLFLVDRSGSMQGTRIESARLGLDGCLAMLAPQDRFQMVTFDSSYEFYRPGWTPAGDPELHAARAFARGIAIRGGTELQPALRASLNAFEPTGREHILILLTDGDVGNEASLLNLVESKIGSARLFAFGIGSAPNAALLERIAQLGRGQARFIAKDAEVAAELTDLFRTLQTPVMNDLQIALLDADGRAIAHSLQPERLPEVFLGRPLQAVFRTSGGAPVALSLEGREGDRPFRQRIALQPAPQRGDALEKLYGQRLYAGTAQLLRRATNEPERAVITQELLATALQFQLVTEFTSRVAIDQVRSRDPNAPLASQQVAQYIAADQSGNGDVITLTPFSVATERDINYTCYCGTRPFGSREWLRDIINREQLDQFGVRALEEAAALALSPQADAAVSRSGAGRGLLAGLPIATLVDPFTIGEISLPLAGPALADVIQLRASRQPASRLQARWADDGRSSASLRLGRGGALPLLALLSWEDRREPQWSAFFTVEKSLGTTQLSGQVQARELGDYGDMRLARASIEQRAGHSGLVKATVAWHTLRREDARQFALESATARHEGLGFLNLDLLTAPAWRLADTLAQIEWSDRRQNPTASHTWFARARWHRQMADWLAPNAVGSLPQARTDRELAFSYTLGLAGERLLFTTDIATAAHATSASTVAHANTTSGTVGFEARPGERVSVFGQWRRGQTLPWLSTGRWENSAAGWRAVAPLRETETESVLGVSLRSQDRRLTGVLTAFHATIRDRSYRDWTWERTHAGSAFVAQPDGSLRGGQSTSAWPELSRAGTQGIIGFKPSAALLLRLAASIDGRDDGPYRGGNRRASLLARYEFRDGALRGVSAGFASSYRSTLTFDDGARLGGGLRTDLLLGYRRFARGREGPTLQLNLLNLDNRAEQLTRFAPPQRRRVQLTFGHGF